MNKHYTLIPMLMLCLLGLSNNTNAQYCSTGLYSYGCIYNDYINSVTTTGGATNISNTASGCNGSSAGYTYFTNKGTLSVQVGQSFQITVVNNPNYSERYAMYMDWNCDGDWIDAGETIYTSPAGIAASGTIGPLTINVPSNAVAGNSRLRVRCVYYYAVTSACSFQYGGETEDYPVTLTPSCAAPNLSLQPQNRTTCEGQEVQFSVAATNATTYQWQVNPGSGWSNVAGANYSGAATTTLSISGLTTAFNSRQYRCVVTGACNNPVNSNAAVLTVNPGPAITAQTTADTICRDAVTSLNVNTAGTVSAVKWQMAVATVGIFSDVPNQPPFTGVTSPVLTIQPVPDSLNNYIFRASVIGGQCPSLNSAPIPMTVLESPVFVTNPHDVTVQPFNDASFEVTSTPFKPVVYYWQASADGINFSNIYDNALYAKTKTPMLTVKAAPLSMSNWWFRAIIKSADPQCGLYYDTSDAAQLKMLVETGVNDVAAANQVMVYPNPVTGTELFISAQSKMEGSLKATVIDKLGRVISSTEIDLSNNKAATIPVGQLAPGIYNLHLTDAEGKLSSTSTFTKQ